MSSLKELHAKLDHVLTTRAGEDTQVYIMVAGTRYPVHVIRALNDVYLVPRRDRPLPPIAGMPDIHSVGGEEPRVA